MTAFKWGMATGTVLCLVQIKKITQKTFNRVYDERMTELRAEEDKKK